MGWFVCEQKKTVVIGVPLCLVGAFLNALEAKQHPWAVVLAALNIWYATSLCLSNLDLLTGNRKDRSAGL